MKKFEIIPHVADVRLKLEADSLQNLFETSLEGMNEILKKGFCKKSINFSSTYKISLTSVDPTALLIDFLSEVLTLSHIRRELFCKVKFKKLNSNQLEAEIFGSKIDKFDEDIKAVSYHEAEITQDKKGELKTNIIFDI